MSDLQFGDFFYSVPPDTGVLPRVTAGIIADAFSSCAPEANMQALERRAFRWFAPVSQHDTSSLDETDIPLSQLLLVTDAASIPQLADTYEGACFLTVTDGENALSEPRLENRIIALSKPLAMLGLLQRVQNLFLRMTMWESELELAVLRKEPLDALLDASTSIIRNFIFISDNEFNVIAQTSKVAPPDDLHRMIIENGCLTPYTIAEKRFRLPEKTFYTREASEICPFDRVSYPIHLNHTYLGSVSMVCNAQQDTQGLRDLFSILVDKIKIIFGQIWGQQAEYDVPSYFFLERLLRDEPMTEQHMESQMELFGIPPQGLFKIVVFDLDPSVDPALAHKVTRLAARMNAGRCKCFQYQHSVVALLYSNGDDGELSHRKSIRELEELVYAPLHVECGVSSVFSGLENMRYAFQQAQIALGFRGAVELELAACDPNTPKGIYLFEDAILYYLVDPAPKDERFLEFAFTISIVRHLHEDDLAHGTNNVALLWFYLQSERNATLTAQRLHMHRNTVLYHIDKIEKRFDFDMSSKSARDWLLLNFKVFFSSQSSESLASILGDDSVRPTD